MKDEEMIRVMEEHCRKRVIDGGERHGQFNPLLDQNNYLEYLLEKLADGMNYSDMSYMIVVCQHFKKLGEKEMGYIRKELSLLQALLVQSYKITINLNEFLKKKGVVNNAKEEEKKESD